MAACSSVVFSSTTESGARLGGLLAADAAPRSEQESNSLAIGPRYYEIRGRLTSTGLLSTETSTSSQDNGSLRGENHLAGHLVNRLDGTGNVCRFALRRRSGLVQYQPSSSRALFTHLVEDLKKLGSVDKRGRRGDRTVDLEVLLSVK